MMQIHIRPGLAALRSMRNLLLVLGLAWLAPGAFAFSAAQGQYGDASGEGAVVEEGWQPLRTYAYPAELLRLFQTLPVQEGGRIKPVDTHAGFQLLKFNSKRTLKTEGVALEDKLTPSEWLLDCVLFPEQAKRYALFIVQDDAVIQAIGLKTSGKKRRDRYSYAQLDTVRQTLSSRAALASRKDPDARTRVDRQVMVLWNNFTEFSDLTRLGAFVGTPLPTSSIPWISAIYQGRDVELPAFLAKADVFKASMQSHEDDPDWQRFQQAYAEVVGRHWQGLGLFPPTAEAGPSAEWASWPEISASALAVDPNAMTFLPALEAWGKFVEAKDDPGTLQTRLEAFREIVVGRAKARGEYGMVESEVRFYGYDFFYRSLYFFVGGFLLVLISWMTGSGNRRGSWWVRGSWAFTSLGLILLTAGITYRCILRSRPPISTLYETILFIAGTIVLLALICEWLTRERLALAAGAFLGALGMFMAGKYELREAATAGDTMPSLQAVLDTNFWLATHVTTINLGYAAGLLACGLGHIWLGLYFFSNRSALGSVARMTYGVLCFSLLFSVVGTILGGVWANDSWGRFWGWDPKENGALLICIWELIILHARMGGFIRPFGFAVMNVLLGVVVATSWWGVNLLGVGLHSYGFTEGVGFWLMVYFAIEGAVVLLAWAGKLLVDSQSKPAQAS